MDFIIHQTWAGVHAFLVHWIGSARIESYKERGMGFSPVRWHTLRTPKCKVSEVWQGGHVRRGRVRKLRGVDVQPTPLKFYTGMPALSLHRCHLKNSYASTLNFPWNVLGTCYIVIRYFPAEQNWLFTSRNIPPCWFSICELKYALLLDLLEHRRTPALSVLVSLANHTSPN